jgi:L-glyceraldehyde 3-phosphate reductase
MMINKQIPKTDIIVSPICLGTMTFGSPVGEADAIKLVHHAMDEGINFIDTANMYHGYNRSEGSAGGVAEEIIGKAVANRRNKVVIATKVGMQVGDAPEDDFTSPAAILKQLDLSLKRLKTDVVDLYYLHRPDPSTPMIEILSVLDELINNGKIRCYGISNYSAKQLKEMLAVADANCLSRPVICQPGLSYLKQDAMENLIPLCEKEKIAVNPYQILQGGLLTGKYKRGSEIPKDSRKAEMENWVWELSDELFDKIESFETEAKTASESVTQHAIRWTLKQPAVVSAIIGVKSIGQIDEAIAAI